VIAQPSFLSANTIIQRENVNTRDSRPNETEQTPFLFVIIEMGQDNKVCGGTARASVRSVGAAPALHGRSRVRKTTGMEEQTDARALVAVSSMTASAPPRTV